MIYSCALDILSTSAVNNSNIEAWCLLCEMMCFEPCLSPHAYLNSGLPGASPSILPFLFLAIDLLLSTCLKEQMALLPLHTAPSYLMSPLLAHILRKYYPNSSASSVSRGAVGRVCGMRLCACCSQHTQSTGGKFSRSPSSLFYWANRQHLQPWFNFMLLSNMIYVKAIVSLVHLFPFPFQL